MSRIVLSLLIALILSGCGGPSPDATSTPSTPDGVEPVGSAALRELPRGAAPAISYAHDSVVHHPNGDTVQLPRLPHRARVLSVTSYARGLMLTDGRIFEGTTGLYLFESGRLHQIDGCTSGGRVSPGGRYVAWVTSACPESGQTAPTTVHRRGPGGTRSQIVTTAVDPATLLRVWGFEGLEVVFGPLFTPTGQRQRLWSTDLCSPPVRLPTAAQSTVRITARTSTSPDGRHTLDVGRWRREVRIRSAQTGELVARLTLPKRVRVGELRWESNTTILAQASAGVNGRTQALVRGDLQGNLERATPSVSGQGFPHQFIFVDRG